MVRIEFDLDISDESMESLLEQAGYGISYWADSASVDMKAATYTVTENEEGENKVHVIPFKKIEEAFWKAANPSADIKGWHNKHETRRYALDAVIDGLTIGNGDIDAGHVDADLADNIIQLAAFGEVIYG